ncbi:hypothetical protein [Kocuria rhizophila]|uniref:hypothetical protein n=1 Tax=Kocuria rhizophila TaxID=72000 RepID=UPI001EF4CDD4|nr:hypothetical protein [Kocuria rhizophila]
MTRTIKVSEVRPGMEVQWTSLGITRRCTGEVVDAGSPRDGVNLRTSEGGAVHIPGDAEVTVLTEPQPEEPTAFGARVVAGRERFLRCDCDDRPWRCVSVDGALGYFVDWSLVCEAGPVTVIDVDPSWTVPETPVVPERIEEWPEHDEHLRGYEWRDRDGRPWVYSRTHGRWYNFSSTAISKLVTDEPKFGPWTRVTDA